MVVKISIDNLSENSTLTTTFDFLSNIVAPCSRYSTKISFETKPNRYQLKRLYKCLKITLETANRIDKSINNVYFILRAQMGFDEIANFGELQIKTSDLKDKTGNPIANFLPLGE